MGRHNRSTADRIIDDCRDLEEEMALRSKKNRSILEDMQLIIKGLREMSLSNEFLLEYGEFTRQICKTYNLTTTEAIFFTLFVEESDRHYIDFDDLKRILSCDKVKILHYARDIEQLRMKRLIRKVNREGYDISYQVSKNVIDAISKDTSFKTPNNKNLSISDFFYRMGEIFDECRDNDSCAEDFTFEIEELVKENPKLEFVKQLKNLKMGKEDVLIFLFFCHYSVNEDDDHIMFGEIKRILEKPFHAQVKCAFRKQTHILFEMKLIEVGKEDIFGRKDYYQLTKKAKNEFLQDIYISNTKKNKNVIECEHIKEKQMFYNPKEQAQIETLKQFLQPVEFLKIKENLSNNNFRTGFTCIFYGSPGTGKTETALQLAKQTGRDVFQVNISEMKSMWFGQSEKIIQELFDEYSEMLKKNEVAPILLFNEADAIFSKRKDINNNSGVGQTENAIQNIILQEMEKLQGILIATTNLTQNLDKAFERRFLYKIKFEQPSIEAKEAIWKSMLKNIPAVKLNKKQYQELASHYDFSGGQIENIARKCQIESILKDEIIRIDKIRLFCDEELLIQENRINKIGFVK